MARKQKKANKKKPKKKQEKNEAPKKTAKTPKNSFSVISQIFPFFLAGFSTFPFFDTLAQKALHPEKHYKN